MRTRLHFVLASSVALLLQLVCRSPLSAQEQDPRSRATLGVLAFTNAAMRDRSDWEAQRFGVAELVTTMLRYHPRLTVLERQQIEPLLAEQDLGASGRVDAEAAARIGRLLGARYMLLGTISVDLRNRLRLAVRAVEVETSRVLDGEIVEGDAYDVHVLVDSLTDRLLDGLSLPALPPRRNPAAVPQEFFDSAGRAGVPAMTGADSGRLRAAAGAAASLSPATAIPSSQSAKVVGVPESPRPTEARAPSQASSPIVRRTMTAINEPAQGERAYRAFQLMAQALVAERRGRIDVAISEYRRALQLMPELVAARDNLARLTSR